MAVYGEILMAAVTSSWLLPWHPSQLNRRSAGDPSGRGVAPGAAPTALRAGSARSVVGAALRGASPPVGFRSAIGSTSFLWSGPRLALERRRGPLLGAGSSLPFPLRSAWCQLSRSPRGRRDSARDLGLHQLRGDHRHRLREEIGVLVDQGLGDDLGGRHAWALGHRGASFRQSTLVVNRRVWGPRWPELLQGGSAEPPPATAGQLHHFYRRDRRSGVGGRCRPDRPAVVSRRWGDLMAATGEVWRPPVGR